MLCSDFISSSRTLVLNSTSCFVLLAQEERKKKENRITLK